MELPILSIEFCGTKYSFHPPQVNGLFNLLLLYFTGLVCPDLYPRLNGIIFNYLGVYKMFKTEKRFVNSLVLPLRLKKAEAGQFQFDLLLLPEFIVKVLDEIFLNFFFYFIYQAGISGFYVNFL